MLWPMEPVVHDRDVEQRLLQIETLLFRLERETVSFPLGRFPVSNNFPLPPVPVDDCSTTCITGTPTIAVGGSYAFRRLSVLTSGASALVYLDYDAGAGAWLSGTIPLITPLVCSGQSVNLRWKMTASGTGIGQVTLVLQYQVPIVGPTWNDGPTWTSTTVWNPYCGLSFTGGDDFDPGLSCNQSADEDVCVNPVSLCDGEAAFSFFNSARVLTFTVAGLGGGGSGLNRSWSLAYAGSVNAMFTQNASGNQASITPNGDYLLLRFPTGISFSGPYAGTYRAAKCDVLIPGVTRFDFVSSTAYSGWPSYIDVTCT